MKYCMYIFSILCVNVDLFFIVLLLFNNNKLGYNILMYPIIIYL